MTNQLEALREPLAQRVTATLKEHAINNRSGLPPFRLPQAAQRIVAGLIGYAAQPDAGAAVGIGHELGEQGLSLRSLLAAGQAMLGEVLALGGASSDTAQHALLVNGYVAALANALAETERQEIISQRQEIERALQRTVENQQQQETSLRRVIEELSTPIIPVYSDVLVLPIVGSLDSRRSQQITEQLLITIAERQTETVIVDITGVPVLDTIVANHLIMSARAVRLLGAQVLLVGISAEVAQTIVQLGVALEDVTTLADLQSGIEYALRQQGLGIAPLR
jgi:rsbT co-antagonist protein RsbR